MNVGALVERAMRHLNIALRWDADELALAVRDRDDDRARPLEGRWRAPGSV